MVLKCASTLLFLSFFGGKTKDPMSALALGIYEAFFLLEELFVTVALIYGRLSLTAATDLTMITIWLEIPLFNVIASQAISHFLQNRSFLYFGWALMLFGGMFMPPAHLLLQWVSLASIFM